VAVGWGVAGETVRQRVGERSGDRGGKQA